MAANRCDAILERALEQTGIARATITEVEYGAPNGMEVELGGTLAAVVQFHLDDGSEVEHEVWCIGILGTVKPWCTNDPRPDPFT